VGRAKEAAVVRSGKLVKVVFELAVIFAAVPVVLAALFGISALTRALKVGVAALPVVGPAKTVFAVSVANVTANVPLLVIVEGITDRKEGTVIPTEVTVPVPAAGRL